MIRTGLEFAPGTTDDCKQLVGRLFQPGEILGAYRAGRQQFRSGDLVLLAAEDDPSGFAVKPRAEYVREIRQSMGARAPAMLRVLTMASKSAHQVARLPFEADAMWLVIARRQAIPVMVVLFAAPYEAESTGGVPRAVS